ncbi:hypothetical protein [Xanthovirga aplysinae]|uniref:hypothetical protein n=1 Tax=Xanthovirga aplysinae TaxID=2529853 RepID=UPI0012BBFFF3|nr:hypothetical protein [Xanthovirga aplysinae]MTI33645.1 hypothetical protein [Xanthovirga aplysinae]
MKKSRFLLSKSGMIETNFRTMVFAACYTSLALVLISNIGRIIWGTFNYSEFPGDWGDLGLQLALLLPFFFLLWEHTKAPFIQLSEKEIKFRNKKELPVETILLADIQKIVIDSLAFKITNKDAVEMVIHFDESFDKQLKSIKSELEDLKQVLGV